MTAQVEEIVDGAMGREKALRLAGRFEPPHLSLLLPGGLMRQLGAVVQSLVLTMAHARHDDFFGRGIALQLISDQHPRDVLEPLE